MSAGPAARSQTVAFVSLVVAFVFFAGNYVVADAIPGVDPVSLVILRWAIAFFPLLGIAVILERPRFREVLRHWPWLIALSMLGLLGYNLLLYYSLQYVDALNASLINAFNPALISLAAVFVLREKLTVIGGLGILIALMGGLIVLSGGDPAVLLNTGFGPGDLLMIGAIGAWTAYTIVLRKAPPIPPITSTAIQAAVTVLVLIPFVAIGGLDLPDGGAEWGAVLFIGLLPSVLSYLLWNRALVVIPAARAGVFMNLITVFTALYTVIAGHPYSIAQLTGGAIIIAGVVLANARAFRSQARIPG